MESKERIDGLMSRYVSGVLPLPAQVLVESHLQLSTANRSFVHGLEALAGDALDAERPIALTDHKARLDSVLVSQTASSLPTRTRAASKDGIFPKALRDFVGLNVDDVEWRTKMPGFREYDMGEIDGCHVNLFWIRPGRAIPGHTHEGLELSLVLDGAFVDETGRYGRGDISVNDESVDHRPVAEKTVPCIGMAVTDGPLRLTGSLSQRLSDILWA